MHILIIMLILFDIFHGLINVYQVQIIFIVVFIVFTFIYSTIKCLFFNNLSDIIIIIPTLLSTYIVMKNRNRTHDRKIF